MSNIHMLKISVLTPLWVHHVLQKKIKVISVNL